jgi:mono/diheme cytochrome c family protein
MSRIAKLLVLPAAVAVMVATAACGTQRIDVAKNNSQPDGGVYYHGAVLFSQRCAGCHTLSYAGTHGSSSNPRDDQGNSGPNFDQRCEHPIDRVLYAIENGGFSGQYMPQNIVVGHDAVDVAEFVAHYSGSQIPKVPGVKTCAEKNIGHLPSDTDGLSPAATKQAASQTSLKVKPTARKAAKVAATRGHAKKHSA